MSRYRGNDDTCPHCGLKYRDLRTGHTYESVWLCLSDNSDDPADWRYKRRGTVLGHWHQLKQEAWRKHLSECEQQAEHDKGVKSGVRHCRPEELGEVVLSDEELFFGEIGL